jgi:hypothetical protein
VVLESVYLRHKLIITKPVRLQVLNFTKILHVRIFRYSLHEYRTLLEINVVYLDLAEFRLCCLFNFFMEQSDCADIPLCMILYFFQRYGTTGGIK